MAIEQKTIKQEVTKANLAEVNSKERKLVYATARYIRISPQKVRLVADLIRNKTVEFALEQLHFSSKNSALPILKLINSAVANAVNNFNLKKEHLFIKTLTVDGGPVLDRFRPRAYGQGSAIRKRTSHINIILEERSHNRKKSNRSFLTSILPKKTENKSHDHQIVETEDEKDKPQTKQTPKSEGKQGQQSTPLKRRLFNRKTGQ